MKTLKRKHQDLENVIAPKGAKKNKLEPIVTPQFIKAVSLKTEFLTPALMTVPNDQDELFCVRIIRQIEGEAKVDIPEISIEEARILLQAVSDFYTDSGNEKEKRTKKIKSLTKKEQRLVTASERIQQGCYSEQTIGRLTGIAPGSVYNLQQRIIKRGSIFPLKKGTPPRLQPHHHAFIREYFNETEGTKATLKVLRQALLSSFQDLKSLSFSTLHAVVHKLGFRFKRVYTYPERRNVTDTKRSRSKVVRSLLYCLAEGYDVLFVDETSVHLNLTRPYGWAKKGERVEVPVPPKSRNYSVIVAVSDSSVLGCEVIKDGAKQEDYLGFITNLLRCYDLLDRQKKVVVFADNASIHTAKIVKEHLGRKVTFLFNAPHSPMLNPIEEFFMKFKYLLRNEHLRNEYELVMAIQEVIRRFESSELRSYVRHTLSFVDSCLNEEDIIS